MLTIVLCAIAFFAGLIYGSENPNIAAEAQAELHKAQAAALRFETKLKGG